MKLAVMRLIAVVTIGIGSQLGCSANRCLNDDLAIRRFTEQYARSFEEENASEVIALMTEDFIALTPGKPPLIGKRVVKEQVTADLEQLDVKRLRFEPVKIVVTDNWAWTWGRSEVVMVTPERDEPVSVQGKYLWILQRQPDGDWKIACDSAHGE